MNDQLSQNVWGTLACSHCGHELTRTESSPRCAACQVTYQYTESGSLDMRLIRQKQYSLEFDLNTPLVPDSGFCFGPLSATPQPEVDFSSIAAPFHLRDRMLSYFPRARSQDSLALDLGCGAGLHEDVCKQAGFEWVGLDYQSPRAPILGDAHALPFRDESFDFVLSLAVLEHIRFPFVAMREAFRVLRPGGRFIGSVAFLEPFHGDSFYHHTHLGTYNSLQCGGFKVDKIAPIEEWHGLRAQAEMALFPRMPHVLSRSIIFPVQALHRLWWKAAELLAGDKSNITEERRMRETVGSFFFVATKEQ
jgi:SAM-dependent methyltransferase